MTTAPARRTRPPPRAPTRRSVRSAGDRAGAEARQGARARAATARRAPAARRDGVDDVRGARAAADGRQPPWGDETPVCAIGDASRCAALLKRFGVVVFRGVVPAGDRSRLESLFWDWLEREHEGVDRARPATHAPRVFDSLGHRNSGVVNTGSIGQSDLLWAARQHAGVVDAWRTVWGLDMTEPAATTRQLVTSFDGCGVWRNPCHPAHAGKANVRTAQSWYHLGALTVWGAGGHTGSTVVCPGSHKQFAENCARGGKAGRGSFVRMAGRGDAEYCARTARQALAPRERAPARDLGPRPARMRSGAVSRRHAPPPDDSPIFRLV
ncbi:hypothetical protein SO694_00132055 [Aureococcus anophagefferens]|uniref:Uncharacterized protein n=1 Tax=Aureococcus anophagefferens TaxID=44056 RepID=A0ABR1GG52_AURAN